MNGISSIRPEINTGRQLSVNPNNRKVAAVSELKTATEADKKKNFDVDNEKFGTKKNKLNERSKLYLSDSKYYRANLLSEIVNKMSGLEIKASPGQFVEYYA